MTRWVLVFLALLTIHSSAMASLSPKQRPVVRMELPTQVFGYFRPEPVNEEFRLTMTTEVLLNGRPCRYKDVPDGATIILLETATNESKEILKIHFQTTSRRSSPAGSKRPRP
jgi:hypothetical protein